MSRQVAADLRAAADVLERDGWTQGHYKADDGCRCAAGAVYAALGYDDPAEYVEEEMLHRVYAAFEALLEFLHRPSQAHEGAVIGWNDEGIRTAAEVIAALRAAAEEAER